MVTKNTEDKRQDEAPAFAPASGATALARKQRPAWLRALAVVLWVAAGFIGSQFIVLLLVQALAPLGLLSAFNETVLMTAVTAAIYVVALAVVLGVPRLFGLRTSAKELGTDRSLTFTDIGLAIGGFVAYMIASAFVINAVSSLVPAFDAQQVQDVGFQAISQRYEYILAFFILVIVAPCAEELLFRGYLYGKLRGTIGKWLAIVVTSVLFGVAHGQWNVGIDTFVLSLFLCSLREFTGKLWPAVLVHMIKNGIAYYFLFVNPSFLNMLGG